MGDVYPVGHGEDPPGYWQQKFQDERDRRLSEVAIERDRRLTEIAIEKEKALKIKETADLAALGLARDIQTYKDEKANNLREQIARERGDYVTMADHDNLSRELRALITPFTEYVNQQQGRAEGVKTIPTLILALASLIAFISTAIAVAIAVAK